MNLSQRQLNMFVITAAMLNISRASEVLHISQPALSRALQELESQLGVKLLLRTTRHLSLTHEGSQFLPVAQRLLRDLQQAASDLLEQATGLTGTVTLALGTAFGCTVLPGILRSFAVSHPGVRLKLIDDNSAGISSHVLHAEADLGIGSLFGDTSGMVCQLMLTAPLGLLILPEMAARLELTEVIKSGDLTRLPLLKEPNDSSIMKVLQSHGSVLVPLMGKGVEVTSLSMQLALAQAGLGIAVVSSLGASHPQATGLLFIPLVPAIERQIYMMQRRDRELNPSAKALASVLQSGLAQATLHPSIKLATLAGLPAPRAAP